MSRQFPRFLFSQVSHGKSLGQFVIYTLYPKAILKVYTSKYEFQKVPEYGEWGSGFGLKYAEKVLSSNQDAEHERVLKDALVWVLSQVKGGFIQLTIGNQTNALKRQLIDIGFKFMAHTITMSNGLLMPVDVDHYGDYVFSSENTSLHLSVDSRGWELADGQPHIDYVYATGEELDLKTVVDLLLKYGKNRKN
jgi:hypothetical protein